MTEFTTPAGKFRVLGDDEKIETGDLVVFEHGSMHRCKWIGCDIWSDEPVTAGWKTGRHKHEGAVCVVRRVT